MKVRKGLAKVRKNVKVRNKKYEEKIRENPTPREYGEHLKKK